MAYLLHRGPAGMTVDSATGQRHLAADGAQPGRGRRVLYAYDSRGGWGEQEFTIHVAGGNRAPVLRAAAGHDREATRASRCRCRCRSAIRTATRWSYWADRLPPRATVTADTHTLQLDPDFEAAGTYRDVTVPRQRRRERRCSHDADAVRRPRRPAARADRLRPTARSAKACGSPYFDGYDPDGDAVALPSSHLLPPVPRWTRRPACSTGRPAITRRART